MKFFLFFLFLCGCFGTGAFAQTDSAATLQKPPKAVVPALERAPSAAYLQLGGAGFMTSLVYDRRFGKQKNGFGFAIGIGGVTGGAASAFTFPLSINVITGEGNHFFEFAVGTTYTTGEIDVIVRQSGWFFFHHLNIGYRYQRVEGGFFFRGGISPLFFKDNQATVLPYLGLGVSF